MKSKTNGKCLKFPIVLKIKCIPMILLRTNTQLLFEAGSTQVRMQKLDNFLRVTLRYPTQGKMRDCPLEAGQPSHSESCVISWESYILRVSGNFQSVRRKVRAIKMRLCKEHKNWYCF